jgi:hypothetical protein
MTAPTGFAVHKKITTVALAAALAGCGGGADAPPTPASTATFNLDAALTSAFTNGASTGELHAFLFGSPYTVSETFVPAPDDEMRGVTYRRAFDTMVLRSGSTTLAQDQARLYFVTNPLQIAYFQGPTGLTVYTPVGALPTDAHIGQSGVWNTQQFLPADGSTPVSVTQTWSLEPDTSDATALACIGLATQPESAWSTRTTANCYRIDSAGNLLPGGASP